jgi:hypothetical protein
MAWKKPVLGARNVAIALEGKQGNRMTMKTTVWVLRFSGT